MKLWLVCGVALVVCACREEPLTTIDVACGYGEATFEIATFASPRDVAVEGPGDLRGRSDTGERR